MKRPHRGLACAALLLLALVGGWMQRRPPAWLREDPFQRPFGQAWIDTLALEAGPAGGAAVSASDAGSEPRVVHLDTVGVASLVRLPGIGPVIAGRVLEHRDQAGPVLELEELLAVKGIGERTLERLRPWLRVGAGADSSLSGAPSGAPDPQPGPAVPPLAEKAAGRAP